MVHDFTARLVAVAVALFTILPAVPVDAGPDEAREYFNEAKQAYSAGEYQKAADLLEKAYSEEANLTYQYNRIRALQGAEEYERALEVLETYEQPMLDAEGFEDISTIKRELQEQLGETSGDEPSGKTETGEGESDGGADDGTDEQLQPAEPGETTTTADETDTDAGPPSPVLGWGLVGGGGALLTTGILFSTTLLLPESIRSQVQDADGGKVQFDSESDFETFMTHRSLAIGFITVGALATGAGTFFLLKNRASQSKSADLRPRIDVAPTVSTDRVGARLKIAF